jgi:hypothetical protein
MLPGDAAAIDAWFSSSQVVISAKGEGFSLYPFFSYQTGIAYGNPNPFS